MLELKPRPKLHIQTSLLILLTVSYIKGYKLRYVLSSLNVFPNTNIDSVRQTNSQLISQSK